MPAAWAPAVRPPSGGRLTDRGIAVILVAGTMIVLAALMMIGLTAVTVTGDGHAPVTVTHSVQP